MASGQRPQFGATKHQRSGGRSSQRQYGVRRTLTSGILQTKDGGGTWQALNGGLRSLDVRAIAVDAGNANVLYAGLENGGAYKSVDAGANWQTASAGMDPGASFALSSSIPPIHR